MKTVLLKLTGELLDPHNSRFSQDLLASLAMQIKQLQSDTRIGIVIGGGNFFRGAQHARSYAIKSQSSHYVGMLATVMNGIILQDIFQQHALPVTLFTALECPAVAETLNIGALEKALSQGQCIIFSGGTGNPYFTTDTTAVIRALQMNADILLKGTKVAGVYDKDPLIHSNATFLPEISYTDALVKEIGIMDRAAFTVAQEHKLTIRVFNIFEPDGLLKAIAGTIGTVIH